MTLESQIKGSLELSRDFVNSLSRLDEASIAERVEQMTFNTAHHTLYRVVDCLRGQEHVDELYVYGKEEDREQLQRVHTLLKQRLERNPEDAERLKDIKHWLGPNGTTYYFDLEPYR
ncbi:hypothetical protein A2715_00765 [Candidatus Woesebacteria bacterium RIFCSPHIGHO2_01_FULL_39_32]|uniref:Uncharacterized protein n=1 Tax=Candidatus Woesebacteria bacterium RIFCSPLOWO2_01_FULL_39_25 TaxID=1802521 RepID=A0A1F8BI93_9BACT|nr:MAG: hypothetical protein A2124_03565 [Candidatus Woesebacteria bacterium GWB1_37_5]OGM24446.1 MAG: hypothetical protein A2715_00765 [Candidatus Woesebacteria bacterium RIFCSPHIGHO2_01_FULL_39_32]OGM35549.1 MAG: hypothetical protein A3F01_02505 [Candidatus Woesebacteria bacterium RIFCSPHIGHO2_12_FULL_38_11]OGM63752.1 MAG: hypothetical protein A2893_02100 [Candidatus Woesebacteria bacterium RIFCSPLOWO2_01_FULL_39_25]